MLGSNLIYYYKPYNGYLYKLELILYLAIRKCYKITKIDFMHGKYMYIIV